jgi:hypothetical protein
MFSREREREREGERDGREGEIRERACKQTSFF